MLSTERCASEPYSWDVGGSRVLEERGVGAPRTRTLVSECVMYLGLGGIEPRGRRRVLDTKLQPWPWQRGAKSRWTLKETRCDGGRVPVVGDEACCLLRDLNRRRRKGAWYGVWCALCGRTTSQDTGTREASLSGTRKARDPGQRGCLAAFGLRFFRDAAAEARREGERRGK